MNDFEKQKLQRRAKEIEQGIQIPNKLKENYICGPILGSGHFSIVRQVTEISTGEEYAMKIINKLQTFDPRSGIKIHQEIEILKKVKHQYIISLKEVFESETHIFLIMELVRGGELFDMLVERGSFLEKDAVIIIQHLMEGVQYLHNSGIVHRDLKPENILICNCVSKKNKSLYCCTQPWMIKIADFGLARILGEKTIMNTPCGTPFCVAPEVLLCEGYGKEVDLWAIGVIIYILLAGYPPFQRGSEENNISLLYEQILSGDYKFDEEYWSDISNEAKDLISKLLVVDPKKRYTFDQVLKHPWILNNLNNKKKISNEVFQKMKNFNNKRKLKFIIYSLISMKQPKYTNPTLEDLKYWKSLFDSADKDKKGKISTLKMKNLLILLGLDICDPKIKHLEAKHNAIISTKPTSAADIIDFDYFRYCACSLPAKPSIEELKGAFSILDKNKDGYLSYNDLHEEFIKNNIPKEQEEEILEYFGDIKTKKIQFKEFIEILQCSQEFTQLQKKN